MRRTRAGSTTRRERRERHTRAPAPSGSVQGAQQARTTRARAAHPPLIPHGRSGASSTPAAPATSRGFGWPKQYAAKTGRAACARVAARTPCVALMSKEGATDQARDTRKRTRTDEASTREGIQAIIAAIGVDATRRKVARAPGVMPMGANGALRIAMRTVSGSAPPEYPSPPGIHADHAAPHSSDHEEGSDTQAPPTRPAPVPHHCISARVAVRMRSPRAVDAERKR